MNPSCQLAFLVIIAMCDNHLKVEIIRSGDSEVHVFARFTLLKGCIMDEIHGQFQRYGHYIQRLFCDFVGLFQQLSMIFLNPFMVYSKAVTLKC